MIPKSIKNAYQSLQNAQAAKHDMHQAKRAAAQGFREGNLGELRSTTQAMDRVLQNTGQGKVLHKHGNKNERITEHAASAWSRFKSEVPVRTTQLHARNAIVKMAEEYQRLAGDDKQLATLANNILTAVGNGKTVTVTRELRSAVNELNQYVQARLQPAANPSGG